MPNSKIIQITIDPKSSCIIGLCEDGSLWLAKTQDNWIPYLDNKYYKK